MVSAFMECIVNICKYSEFWGEKGAMLVLFWIYLVNCQASTFFDVHLMNWFQMWKYYVTLGELCLLQLWDILFVLILSCIGFYFQNRFRGAQSRVWEINPFILIEETAFGLFLPLYFVFSEDCACFYFIILLAWLIVVFSPSALKLIQHIAVSLRVTFFSILINQ